MSRRRTVRVEDLVGQPVHAPDGRVAGRIEEIRVHRHGDAYEVTEYLLGTGALFERLALARVWFRHRPAMRRARWDQIDISHPERPRLLCAPEQLTRE
ncbi:MAG TPA: hypothetical protein VFA27_09695 [Vicinamibacterales bacterium]|nr:hypothetical protein [Vicinamibacterales bacterium]